MQAIGYTYSIDPVTFRVHVYCFEGDTKIAEHSFGNKFEENTAITSLEDAIDSAEKYISKLKQEYAIAQAAAQAAVTQETLQETPVDAPTVPQKTLSKYEFYTRFSFEELEKLYTLSKDDVKLAVFVKLLDAAEVIDLNNTILQTALQYMQSMDVLSSDRINTILA